MIPQRVRLRVLGRAGASRSLRFRRLRKPRLLGQFVTQEDRNVLKRSSPPAAPGSGNLKISHDTDVTKHCSINEEKNADESIRHDVSLSSSSSTKHAKQTSRSKLADATRRRKAEIDRIERVWNDLEYPVRSVREVRNDVKCARISTLLFSNRFITSLLHVNALEYRYRNVWHFCVNTHKLRML